MPLTERERHDAYEALQETFGERTDTVIEMLRPDHENLSTKQDVALLGSDLRTEMADLRTEMADIRTELKTEMADLRTELKTEMGDLRVAFATDINAAFAAQTRTMMIGLVSAVVLIALSNALAVLAG